MNDENLEDTLRAQLRGAIDPRVPGPAAEQRVLGAVAAAGQTHHFGLHVGPRVGAAIAAAMVVLVVGGALGVSLALRKSTVPGGPSAPAATAPVILPSPSFSPPPSAQPTPTPSPALAPPVAGIQPCAAGVLTARLFDQDGAAGALGGDIALRNNGPVACTLKGYVNLQGVVAGRVVQLGVTHSADGPILNNNNGTLPTVRLVTVRPGQSAYVAFEDSDVPNGPTPCSASQSLLITPPGGHRAVSLAHIPMTLCGGFHESLWIDIAPVSSTPYYNPPNA
jgi:hypothetical protein